MQRVRRLKPGVPIPANQQTLLRHFVDHDSCSQMEFAQGKANATDAYERHFVAIHRRWGGSVQLCPSGRYFETQKLCRTIRSSAFSSHRNLSPDRVDAGQGVRKLGSPIHALWRCGFLFLRAPCQPIADSWSTVGAARYRSVDDALVRMRIRLLVRRAEVAR